MVRKSQRKLKEADVKLCGVVMPISAIGECTESHWTEVQEILFDSIEGAGFAPQLVSDANDVGIIQKRIIQNLYNNPIVVCDVSCKNPNVMFELGLRLAFDKPTIIVKDDQTKYSFDTAPIEHLEYPRDLRFSLIVDFKVRLTEKIQATHKASTSDPNYSTFLKHFDRFEAAKIDTSPLSKSDVILEEIRMLNIKIAHLTPRYSSTDTHRLLHKPDTSIRVLFPSVDELNEALNAFNTIGELGVFNIRRVGSRAIRIDMTSANDQVRARLIELIHKHKGLMHYRT
jgi:hypothetical protein